ncbi:MAG: GTP-binding protein [Planctomycetota bacterium]|nr:MAG: GTP-binding protein [Planctomycetota bacterium]
MSRYRWLSGPDPAAIALLRMPARGPCFDRPLPAPGVARFACLLGSDGEVVDEVVVQRLSEDACMVACHGGPGQRQAIERALAAGGITSDQPVAPVDLSEDWRRMAACQHPAAVRLLASGASGSWLRWVDRIPTVLIVGPSNAGKSTLFNLWLGNQRSLTSERAGTTRDLVSALTSAHGWHLRLVDSAGERETDDQLETAGQSLAREHSARVDIILRCHPANAGPAPQPADGEMVLITKADLAEVPATQLQMVDPAHGAEARSAALLDSLVKKVLVRLGMPLFDAAAGSVP